MDVSYVANVSEVHASSIFRVEACKMAEFMCGNWILYQKITVVERRRGIVT
jgi:hypothetical protein